MPSLHEIAVDSPLQPSSQALPYQLSMWQLSPSAQAKFRPPLVLAPYCLVLRPGVLRDLQ